MPHSGKTYVMDHLVEQLGHLLDERTYQLHILPEVCSLLVEQHLLGVLDFGQP